MPVQHLIFLTAAALTLAGCGRATAAPSSVSDSMVRVTSPDSVLDAVTTVSSVDATTPNVHRVYLVAHGQPVPVSSSESFRADYVDSLRVEWSGNRQLRIRYDKARIFHFTNFWSSREVQNFLYEVELRLEPGHGTSLPERSLPGEVGGLE